MEQKRILLIEDNLNVAQGLHQILGLLGFQSECCDSSEAALEMVKRTNFDLVISDFCLPGMNGLELLQQLRRTHPDSRSILITAFHSPEIQGQAQRWANAYLPKPFEMQRFAQVVQQVLQAPVEIPQRSEDSGISKRAGLVEEHG